MPDSVQREGTWCDVINIESPIRANVLRLQEQRMLQKAQVCSKFNTTVDSSMGILAYAEAKIGSSFFIMRRAFLITGILLAAAEVVA